MKMKKLWIGVMIISFCLSCVACGETEEKQPELEQSIEEEIPDVEIEIEE